MKISTLVTTLMLGATLALPASVLADEDHGPSVIWAKCEVAEVATFSNRVHVRCVNNAVNYLAVRYFASPTTNSAEAARLVTLGTAALTGAGAGHLWVRFNIYDYAAASYGCGSNDCRRPMEMMLIK